jgi:hypothetical protein
MMMLALIVHFLGTTFALHIVYTLCKMFKISINIHNLPVLLIGFMIMLGAISLSIFNLLWYVPTGMILSAACWYLNSIDLAGSGPVPLHSRIRTSVLALIFWPQTLFVLGFILLNFDKIYEKSEH